MERESAFALAEDYFARGNELDTRSPYGYYSLAKHQFWGLWNYRRAHETLLKTYAVQPQDADTNEFLAEIHTLTGNFSTALKYIETSLHIDPLAASIIIPRPIFITCRVAFLKRCESSKED